jgi:hypothetical protein
MALPSTPPIRSAGKAIGSVVDREKGSQLGEPDAARLPVDLYVRAPQLESATSLPRSVAYTDEQEALHKRKIIEDKIEGTQAAAEPSTKSLSS